MRRFENWGDELRYRVERIGNDGAGEDEAHAGGVYDMAMDLADTIYSELDSRTGTKLDSIDLDIITDILYNGVKYGKGVE